MSLPHVDRVGALIAEAQAKLFGWVPYEQYARMFPDETRDKIKGRLRRGQWTLGTHAARGGKYDLWIHLSNVKAWLEKSETVAEPLPFGEALD